MAFNETLEGLAANYPTLYEGDMIVRVYSDLSHPVFREHGGYVDVAMFCLEHATHSMN